MSALAGVADLRRDAGTLAAARIVATGVGLTLHRKGGGESTRLDQ